MDKWVSLRLLLCRFVLPISDLRQLSVVKKVLCAAACFASSVQTPLLFAEQCPLRPVQWLSRSMRNRFYQLQRVCGVDDDLA